MTCDWFRVNTQRRNPWQRLKRNDRFREGCMMSMPFVVIWAFGAILDVELDWLVSKEEYCTG